jgi:hypothetical protein
MARGQEEQRDDAPDGRRASGPRTAPAVAASAVAVLLLGWAGYALASGGGISLVLVDLVLPTLLLAIWIVRGSAQRNRSRPAPRGESDGRDWTDAVERFDLLRGEYAGYECDPVQVLRLPALADVTVPGTARFVDALAEAQALRTDRHPGGPTATRFAAAVEHAEQAWRAAREMAQRIGSSALSPAERATVERVVALLTVARESDSEPERVVAYARARAELRRLDRSGAVRVPLAAQAALDDGARGALPP